MMALTERHDMKVKAFFSTPNFINDLTDLSIKIVKCSDALQSL